MIYWRYQSHKLGLLYALYTWDEWKFYKYVKSWCGMQSEGSIGRRKDDACVRKGRGVGTYMHVRAW